MQSPCCRRVVSVPWMSGNHQAVLLLVPVYHAALLPAVTGMQQRLKQKRPAHPSCSACRDMLPRANEQPPDPPDAPGGADAAAPGVAGVPAAASAHHSLGLPQGSLPGGGGPARPIGAGPGPGAGPANGTSAGAERPGGALVAGPGPEPASGAPAPAEESFRRIQLEATAPGAGLAGAERGLFYGGALARAKRDIGGVGVSQRPVVPRGHDLKLLYLPG